ncbi:hypothetical protein HDV00_006982 [Rhizophlyctis rosea]|nr:hypothetical protein HDV00_006982 [Rhizophlyctis rosea]
MTKEEVKKAFEQRYKQGAAVTDAGGGPTGVNRRYSSRSSTVDNIDPPDSPSGEVETPSELNLTNLKQRPASWRYSAPGSKTVYRKGVSESQFIDPTASASISRTPSTTSLQTLATSPTAPQPLHPNIGGILSHSKWNVLNFSPNTTTPASLDDGSTSTENVSEDSTPMDLPKAPIAGTFEPANPTKGEGYKFVVDVEKMPREEVKRQEVIYELLVTEWEYVRDLGIIINLFMKPMREKSVVDAKGIGLIFSNIELLVPYNQVLLDELSKRRRDSWGVIQCIGDVFDRVAQFFKMYTVYCANQPEALTYLKNQQKTNTALHAFVQELLKHTPPSHPDHELLSKAFHSINHVVDVVNERRRSVENQQKLLGVMGRLEFGEKHHLTHEPSRTYIHEGALTKIKLRHYTPQSELNLLPSALSNSSDPALNNSVAAATPPTESTSKKKKHPQSGSPRFGVLFSDYFVLCKFPSVFSTSGKVIVRKLVDLEGVLGVEVGDGDPPETFTLVLASQKHLHFSSPTPAETQTWIQKFRHTLQDAGERIRPRSMPPSLPSHLSTVDPHRMSTLRGETVLEEGGENGKSRRSSVGSVEGFGLVMRERGMDNGNGLVQSPTLENVPILGSMSEDPEIERFLKGERGAGGGGDGKGGGKGKQQTQRQQQQKQGQQQPSPLTIAQRDASTIPMPGAWTSNSNLLSDNQKQSAAQPTSTGEGTTQTISQYLTKTYGPSPFSSPIATRKHATVPRMPGAWASASSLTDKRRDSVSSSDSSDEEVEEVSQLPQSTGAKTGPTANTTSGGKSPTRPPPAPPTAHPYRNPTPPTTAAPSGPDRPPPPPPTSTTGGGGGGLKKSASVDSLRDGNTSAPSSPSLKARRTLKPTSTFTSQSTPPPATSTPPPAHQDHHHQAPAPHRAPPPPPSTTSHAQQDATPASASPQSVRKRIAKFETPNTVEQTPAGGKKVGKELGVGWTAGGKKEEGAERKLPELPVKPAGLQGPGVGKK